MIIITLKIDKAWKTARESNSFQYWCQWKETSDLSNEMNILSIHFFLFSNCLHLHKKWTTLCKQRFTRDIFLAPWYSGEDTPVQMDPENKNSMSRNPDPAVVLILLKQFAAVYILMKPNYDKHYIGVFKLKNERVGNVGTEQGAPVLQQGKIRFLVLAKFCHNFGTGTSLDTRYHFYQWVVIE